MSEEIDIDDYSRDRSRSPVRNRDQSPGRNSRKDYEAPRGQDRRGGYARRDRNEERGFRDRNRRRDDRRGERRNERRSDRRDREDRPPRRGQMSAADASTVSGDANIAERNYDNSIFIGNIPFEVTAREIEELFSKDFSVVRADIVIRRGTSRGMATVEFSSTSDVEQAIAKFDRTEYQGREIFVRQDYPPPPPAEKKNERPSREETRESRERRETPDVSREPKAEVFVGNLPYNISWQTLKDEFRAAGEVVRADILTDRFGKSRGYGTVVFKTVEDAQAAIDKFDRFKLDGRVIDVRFGRDREAEAPPPRPTKKNSEFTEGVKGNGEPSKTIYVGNLPYITTERDLFDLFETVGHVVRAENQLDSRGRASGNAVVQFDLEELAELAIKNLDNYNYGGRPLKITYAQYPGGSKTEVEDSEMADN